MIAFIVAVATIAVVLTTRRTVIDGRVLATDVFPMIKAQRPHLAKLDCDSEIVVTRDGAVFDCTMYGDTGSIAEVEYHMDRNGTLTERVAMPTGDDP